MQEAGRMDYALEIMCLQDMDTGVGFCTKSLKSCRLSEWTSLLVSSFSSRYLYSFSFFPCCIRCVLESSSLALPGESHGESPAGFSHGLTRTLWVFYPGAGRNVQCMSQSSSWVCLSKENQKQSFEHCAPPVGLQNTDTTVVIIRKGGKEGGREDVWVDD